MAMTSSALKDLSDQNSVGTRLGATSTELIGFYGVTTCVTRQTVTGSISSGALASSSGYSPQQLGLGERDVCCVKNSLRGNSRRL
jgi:hypothetical protein